MCELSKGTPIPRKIYLMNDRNILYSVIAFTIQIFLILNYKYHHNDDNRQIFPYTPKRHWMSRINSQWRHSRVYIIQFKSSVPTNIIFIIDQKNGSEANTAHLPWPYETCGWFGFFWRYRSWILYDKCLQRYLYFEKSFLPLIKLNSSEKHFSNFSAVIFGCAWNSKV